MCDGFGMSTGIRPRRPSETVRRPAGCSRVPLPTSATVRIPDLSPSTCGTWLSDRGPASAFVRYRADIGLLFLLEMSGQSAGLPESIRDRKRPQHIRDVAASPRPAL